MGQGWGRWVRPWWWLAAAGKSQLLSLALAAPEASPPASSEDPLSGLSGWPRPARTQCLHPQQVCPRQVEQEGHGGVVAGGRGLGDLGTEDHWGLCSTRSPGQRAS